MKRTTLSISILLIFGLAAATAEEQSVKPNIVFILADDLGWQDVKCYDVDEPSPYETPHIDALAGKGVLFWQGYAPAPTCAPSRCAIMSGTHPARAQKTHVVGGAPPMPRNRKHVRMMEPWYRGGMPADEVTLAKVLRDAGYATGHTGKWHIAVEHFAFPQPLDLGFDFSTHRTGQDVRGVQSGMKNRLENFATMDPKDPYRLDEAGFPRDPITVAAIDFMEREKARPFFLYHATWLVHTPIQSRSRALLEKYCEKLGVDYPTDPQSWTLEGQNNPYYCAMVESFDHYLGQIVSYLEATDDPRRPGHKLIDNTHIIVSSDNGGMEGDSGEVITDNYPLDKGKISAMEGGTRVPFIFAGPGIAAGVQSEVMINGLDLYPTILAMTGTPKPQGKHLDGLDLVPLLLGDPTDPALVREADGTVRDTMVWHFPHGGALESTIRVGDFKLVRNYDHVSNQHEQPLELYQLYDAEGGKAERVDIEEAHNLAAQMPEKTAAMDALLTEILEGMQASYPSYNPHCIHPLPGKKQVPEVLSHASDDRRIEFRYRENGAAVVQADLLYTTNGGELYEEWLRAPASLEANGCVVIDLPEGTTHYLLNLIDANGFLVSYPDVSAARERAPATKGFAGVALSAE
jgi:arylsulfatase A-like enzyme